MNFLFFKNELIIIFLVHGTKRKKPKVFKKIIEKEIEKREPIDFDKVLDKMNKEIR